MCYHFSLLVVVEPSWHSFQTLALDLRPSQVRSVSPTPESPVMWQLFMCKSEINKLIICLGGSKTYTLERESR